MARTLITAKTEDLQSDSGSVLFSFVQGEQLEFPVTLAFIENTSIGYTYEAVLIEGLNIAGQSGAPSVARPSGITNTLTVWTPTWKSEWSAVTAYDRDDLVIFGGIYYLMGSATGYISANNPTVDTSKWTVYVPNKVYVRFPDTLSLNWNTPAQPTAEAKNYGFFELRVTEPAGSRYTRTWKPMRGLVEFSYSPTHLVA
jgi:hypothetical protein